MSSRAKLLGGATVVAIAIGWAAAKHASAPSPPAARVTPAPVFGRDATSLAQPPADLEDPAREGPVSEPTTHGDADGPVEPGGDAAIGPGVRPGDAGADRGLPGDITVAPRPRRGDEPAPDPHLEHQRRVRAHRLRWHRPGLCDGDIDAAREALHAGFVASPFGDVELFHDPEVSRTVLSAVAEGVHLAGAGTARLLARRPFPPPIWVYGTRDQMLSVSCTNTASIAYFDGAIHLSGDPEHGLDQIEKSVRHEYVHHVLLAIGVPGPMWFQEGVAMYVANETWWRDPGLGLVQWIQREHLPFADLVGAFPHTAEEPYALTCYFQSLMMVLAVVERSGEERLAWLAQRLADGSVLPEAAFAEGMGVDPVEPAWWSAVGVVAQ